ncbi:MULTISPECIES: hypothetical protein [unclassified Nocardia]|uniref:hypothetical protein n=1 Tax=unclassified Nocardia TaxID=2637762 RepID=UPI001CE3DCED|nr:MULTISPECIES: hypothetical protein [unclassified Nocardia]
MIRWVLVLPVVCWLIVARTPRTRLRIGAVLVVIAAVEAAVFEGWILRDLLMTATFALNAAVVVVLLWGLIAEQDAAAATPIRRFIGCALTLGLCTVIVLTNAIIALATKGQRASTPSSREFLPVPSELTVRTDENGGCGGGSATICLRRFEIQGASGAPTAEVVDTVRHHLGTDHGWSLTFDPRRKTWSECRDHGWALDRNSLCVSVFAHDDLVVVEFEESADN